MYCAHCGKPIEERSEFCSNCGRQATLLQPDLKSKNDNRPTLPDNYARGGLILAFGILSLVMFGLILGIPAWVMSSRDLKRMRAGEMSSSTRRIVLVGMVFSIIGTFLTTMVLLVLSFRQ